MAGILLKVINVFHGGHPVFSTPTSIDSIKKSTKKKKKLKLRNKTRWNPRWKATENSSLKQFRRQRNRLDK